MKPRSQKQLTNQHKGVTAIERAEQAAVSAKQLEKTGEYEAAYEALSEFWPDRGSLPQIGDLDDRLAAEICLRAGAIAGWLGSADQIAGSQEAAKNLITRSLAVFQALGIREKIVEAWSELGLCYWREGSYDEARIQFANGLEMLDEGSDLKAILLIRAGIVEVCARRLNVALRFYNEAAPLVDHSEDHGLKGSFHIEFGLVFRRLAAPENREDYLDKALVEYSAASFHFEQAGNTRALARVETNLGYLFFTIGRYTDAHQHLDRARRLFLELGDLGTAARVDESRARTLAAEGRLVEAEQTAKASVKVLEKGGEQAILADALTTYGMVVARLGHHQRAHVLFERAIDVAETTGDREGAGRTRLSIIEELRDKLPAKELVPTYRSAIDLLKGSQDPETGKRLINCADVLFEMLSSPETGSAEFREGSWEGFSFKEHVKEGERAVIERALRDAHGSVTKASRLLGFKNHQNLSGIINTRHPELLGLRSTVRKRHRHPI
jgi:tetratricopeptide (TPR) repeat protein